VRTQRELIAAIRMDAARVFAYPELRNQLTLKVINEKDAAPDGIKKKGRICFLKAWGSVLGTPPLLTA
jgi:hypothetical protein